MAHREVRHERRALLLVGALFLGICVGLNWARGAFGADLCAFEDEPAHAVTGMLARDWVAQGFPAPLAFARDYYLHYPKVALGQWPPLFYVLQGSWGLLFGSSSASLILLLSLCSALSATLLFAAVERDLGKGPAFLAGLTLLGLPLVQIFGASVMTEIPLALLCTAAFLALGRFLDQGRTRDALLFGVLAAAASLTKGNALALAGVPPLAIGFTGRWERWRRGGLWAGAGIVALLAGPWYLATLHITAGSWVGPEPSLAYTGKALWFYARALVHLGGFVLLGAALVGALAPRRPRQERGALACAAAWILSLLALQSVVPSSIEERHLVLIAPALIYLAWVGGLSRFGVRGRWTLALLLLSLVLIERGSLPAKGWRGFDAVARELVAQPELDGRALLVLSDVSGEGALVAAVAQADGRQRMGHLVLRASKVLAHSDWMGRGYQLRFAEATQVADWLEEARVAAVVVDRVPKPSQRFAHHDELLEALELHPERWVRVGTRPVTKNGVRSEEGLVLWRRRGSVPPAGGLDMRWVLGRELPGF